MDAVSRIGRRSGPNADNTQPRIRRAVRAILLTPQQEVLLVRFEFPGRSAWALPGGGVEPGERAEDALRRELAEELGHTPDAIGPHVWSRLVLTPGNGEWAASATRSTSSPWRADSTRSRAWGGSS